MYFLSASRWPFGFLRVDARAAAHRLDRRLERLARQAVLLEQPAGLALVVGEREQEELARDELVAALDRFLVGQVEQVVEVARDGDLAALPLDLRQPLDRLGERRLDLGHGHARAGEQRRGAAVLLVQQRGQQVLRLDEAVVVAERHALGVGQRLLEFGRELVEAHRFPQRSMVAIGNRDFQPEFKGLRTCPGRRTAPQRP